MSKRNYMWDNMKGILILTVVMGHFLYSFDCPYPPARDLYYWIYSFHMPAFLFVSGFFAKRYCTDGVVKPNKVLYLIGYMVTFQLVEYVLFFLLGTYKEFTIFEPYRGLWYLMSMIVYYLLIPVFEKVKPYFAIPLVILFGLFIGCQKDAGVLLAVSRSFVFAPFFFIGYYTSDNAIEKMRNFKGRIPLGIISVVFSISIWFFSEYLFPSKLLRKDGTIIQSLFYGKSGYKEMGFSNPEGIYMRAVSYVIAGLMIIGLIMLVPKMKSGLSHLGKSSLQIYLFHILVNITFLRGSIFRGIVIDSAVEAVLVILVAVAASILFSLKPFSYPFKWIQMGIDKLISLKEQKN